MHLTNNALLVMGHSAAVRSRSGVDVSDPQILSVIFSMKVPI